MANYITCKKEFKSLGKSQIELADININNIKVKLEDNWEDRTNFLKYGLNYNVLKKFDDEIKIIEISENIKLEYDVNGKLYFIYNGNDIIDDSNNDGDILILIDNNKYVYCIVNKIEEKKVYIDYYSLTDNILECTFTAINIIRYCNMTETETTYELKINEFNKEYDYSIPIFLPIMKTHINMSSRKDILIHIKNNVQSINFIFLGRENFYINSLTKNSPHFLTYNNNENSNQDDYTTFVISALFNGDKSWFVAI